MTAVLRAEKVVDIQNDLRDGLGVSHLARKYNVAKNTIYRVKNGSIKPEDRKQLESFDLFWRPYFKCKGCGHIVQKPCLLCALRNKDWKSISCLLINEEHK